jgi:hypothetical protein
MPEKTMERENCSSCRDFDDVSAGASSIPLGSEGMREMFDNHDKRRRPRHSQRRLTTVALLWRDGCT